MAQYPCKGCMTRHNLCWDSCEDYQKAKIENEAIKRAKQKEKDVCDYMRQRSDKIMREVRRKPRHYK